MNDAVASARSPVAGLIMGSSSDWDVMRFAAAVFDEFDIAYETRVVSAHRMPLDMVDYGAQAVSRGLRAIVAGAGGAAHLPGMMAALTPVPVFGVPVPSRYLRGEDSLLSIVQMPRGVPVGTFAIGEAGATNAALHVVANLAMTDADLLQRLQAYRARQTQAARDMVVPPGGRLMAANDLPAAPGAWLGVLGGGQLGRMFCHAAQALGYRVAVLDPAESSPAGMVADRHLCAAYDDHRALDALGDLCVAVTTEFENVPADSLRRLAHRCRTTPSGDAVAVAQDRLAEKAYLQASGVPVAPHAAVRQASDLDACPDALFPGILKTARLGYDGKGQVRVANRDQARQAFASLHEVDCVLEALQPLDYEISVVVARGLDGGTVTYPPSRNAHRAGILALSLVDGMIAPAVVDQARGHALRVADHLDYHGVLCVEFFVLRDGSVIANEMAPRPHNSGHYTQDGCLVSQFEQQARVMAGLPLGDTDLLRPSAMLNLLGDLWFGADGQRREPDWAGVLAVSGTRLHLYAKEDARPGRKMGHINILGATAAELQARTALVRGVLGLPDA